MIKKEKRLTTKDFSTIFNNKIKGINLGEYPIFIKKIENNEMIKGPKIGVSISSKVVKNSTDRNKIKRRIVNIYKEFNRDANIYIISLKQVKAKKDLSYSNLKKILQKYVA
jgi:ribonuclease P protein component